MPLLLQLRWLPRLSASLEAAQKAERAQRRRSRQDIHPHASIDPGMTSEIRLNIAE